MHFVHCNTRQKVKITAVQPSGSSTIVLKGTETITPHHCFSPCGKPPLTKEACLADAALRYICAVPNGVDAAELLGMQSRLMLGLNRMPKFVSSSIERAQIAWTKGLGMLLFDMKCSSKIVRYCNCRICLNYV